MALKTDFHSFLRQCGGCAVIDGGLSTELERHGADLKDPLWSAKCLITSPHLISKGFEARGIFGREGEALLEKSVKVACEARDLYHNRLNKGSFDISGDGIIRQHPVLVAASVGSYGAYLADGSEYRGVYGCDISVETLKDFHRRRVQILVDSGADLIAFETIPNKLEAKAYAELLEEKTINVPAWFSFTCKDDTNVVSGDSIEDCASIADSCEKVVAVGINCTAPRHVHGLIKSIRKATKKPILVYPNSGETYDAVKKEWMPSTGNGDKDFVSYVGKWRVAGAALIGGCCRTTPNTIRAISKILGSY
ncbi:homocysteine S-methyltransferase 3-like isoform X2 [Andrographis paniculata]|uniref:homocysteine S-methyltransferase 3-like isoform X2 n=1 Tax=Andrographis paniculata TaxID=175694 RepID=UPI0021E70DD1|nr:homocysteine S-methyltransferase 3-like isoform X2 [Andrographis paniculata]